MSILFWFILLLFGIKLITIVDKKIASHSVLGVFDSIFASKKTFLL